MLKKICILLIFTAILLVGCAPKPISTPPANGLIEINLPVGYIPNVQFAPLYVAMDKGWYRDAGLEVKIDYSFETDAVALVGAEKLQFAMVSGEQILLGRAQGLPIVSVMSWYQQYPVGIVSMADANIKQPADLKGKKIGTPVLSGASYIGMEALLNAGGLNDSDVQVDTIGFNQVEALASGQEDAVVIYVANEPIQLKAKGYDVNVMRVADYLQLVSNGLITNEAQVKNNPDLVRAMVSATLKGISYTIDHPDEAYEISKKYVENLANADENVQKEVLNTSIGLWKDEKIGYGKIEAWQNMNDVLVQIKLLSNSQEVSQAFTNDFLP